ncbi:MAG: glycosyltransferase family 4 protein, partial [Bacteroidia bacterium]
RWFLRDVWPLVESKNVKCFFAGRHMPKDIEALAGENIKILGEVKSAKDFLNQLDLLIVPLQSGSGVRIKVLESMAYGLPILATKMGYEGIHAQNGVSILEANTAQNFAAKIDQVANNQVDLNALAQQAQVVLTKQHSPIKAAELLVTKISKSKSE